MALIATLSLTNNGTVSIPCKNSRNGKEASYTMIAYGTFGGGTLKAQVSADNGVTYVDLINNNDTVASTSGFAEDFYINSDPRNPVLLGFNLAGATAPSITIRIYDTK